MTWLTGCKGMLGQELARQLQAASITFIGTGHEVDITDKSAVDHFAADTGFGKKEENWIINCSAYTAVDKAEDEPEKARAVNAVGVRNLAQAAKDTNARFIHISTDYVFDGTAAIPYTENAATAPQSVYGGTKREGEQAVLELLPDALWILRTSWLYGYDGKNFVYTMLRLMNSRDRITVVNDQYGTPTFCGTVASAIVSIIKSVHTAKELIPSGIYHCTDRGATTWYEFATEILKNGKVNGLITHDCTITPCTTKDYPVKAKRPAYSVLDTTKLSAALAKVNLPQLPASWQEPLKKFLSDPKLVHGTVLW